MKKLYLLIVLAGMVFFAHAQDESVEKKQQDIEALKVAFLSRELELTPDEAQKFWPLYNQYSRELKATVREDQDILDRDEKVLNLRKKYRDQFTGLLGAHRMNKMYNADGRFRQILINAIRNQKGLRNNPNRPLQRRNQ